MSNQIVKAETVYFNGNSLITVQKAGKSYVAMKPIVEGMGLQWARQSQKIQDTKRYTHMYIPLQTAGGSQEMLCLPLNKLNGWLFSVNPDKVKPEVKNAVTQYQDECFQVLFDYWSHGIVENPRVTSNTSTSLIEAFREAKALAYEFGFEGNQQLLSANSYIRSTKGVDLMEKMGVTHLLNDDQMEQLSPTEIGDRFDGVGPRKINQALLNLNLQAFWHSEKTVDGKVKKIIHWSPTEIGKPHSVLLDTGKNHSDGAPVQQLKWKESVIPLLEKLEL